MREAIPLSQQQNFTYVIPVTLAANASGSYTLILANDSEFDLQAVSATTSADAITDATPPNNFNLIVRDSTSGRDYSSAPINRNNFAGLFPRNIENEGRCIRFPRKQQLDFQFTNLTGSSLTIQVALKGYKVFTRL
jgi:hypothetical protein